MVADDVILRVRTRLRDTNYQDLSFSDNQILDVLNDVQNDLIFAFNMNLQKLTLNVENGEIYLPSDILNLVEVLSGGIKIPLKTASYVIQQGINSSCIYQKSPRIYGVQGVNGEIELYVNFEVELKSVEDTMFLGRIFVNALIYGSLMKLLQTETNAQNLDRVQFFENLYNKELQILRDKINHQREKKNLKTPYVKV